MNNSIPLQRFLDLSAEITAFSIIELQGTGQTQAYFDTVIKVVGVKLLEQLLQAYRSIDNGDSVDKVLRESMLRREIFGDPCLGPIARNIIKLWYVGIWYQLPRDWSEVYGARENDITFMVSASAYSEGLLWPAVGANPPGAKAPGYASWAEPPIIPGLTVNVSSEA